jgi:hypothetical protein
MQIEEKRVSLEYILPAIAQNIERERQERVKVLAEAASSPR